MGLINEPAARFDPNVVDTLQNHLFEFTFEDGSVQAIDLFATNIQRGRDHGLPSYVSVREKCGLRSVRDFGELNDVMHNDAIARLRMLYK